VNAEEKIRPLQIKQGTEPLSSANPLFVATSSIVSDSEQVIIFAPPHFPVILVVIVFLKMRRSKDSENWIGTI
jgi:hypothetical protein